MVCTETFADSVIGSKAFQVTSLVLDMKSIFGKQRIQVSKLVFYAQSTGAVILGWAKNTKVCKSLHNGSQWLCTESADSVIGSKAFQVIGLEMDMKSIFGKQKILKSVTM